MICLELNSQTLPLRIYRIFAKFTNKNYYEHIQIIERLPVLKVIKAFFKGFQIYTHLVLFSDIYAFSLISRYIRI